METSSLSPASFSSRIDPVFSPKASSTKIIVSLNYQGDLEKWGKTIKRSPVHRITISVGIRATITIMNSLIKAYLYCLIYEFKYNNCYIFLYCTGTKLVMIEFYILMSYKLIFAISNFSLRSPPPLLLYCFYKFTDFELW